MSPKSVSDATYTTVQQSKDWTFVSSDENETGTVVDFLFNGSNWEVAFVLGDCRTLVTSRPIWLPVEHVEIVDTAKGRMELDLSGYDIGRLPSHNPGSSFLLWERESARFQLAEWTEKTSSEPVGHGLPDEGTLGENALDLVSAEEVRGANLLCADDACGYLDDLVIDTRRWSIRFLVIDISAESQRDKVLLPAGLAEFHSEGLCVDVDCFAVLTAPDIDYTEPHFSSVFESELLSHYGLVRRFDDMV